MVITSNHRPRGTRWCTWSLALLLLSAAPAYAQGVHVALIPQVQSVAPGAGVDLELDVTEPGSQFNGYETVVSYDPSALTFVPTSPTSLQQGSYMTGACGSTFHIFQAAADSLHITHVLLCGGIFLTGPGQLYKLHFTASTTPQVTVVRIRRIQFVRGGNYVTPVFTQDAEIGIGVVVGVGDPRATPRASLVRAAPNPVRDDTAIRVDTALPGEEQLVVCDLLGRTVRHLQSGVFRPGSRTVSWDGRDDGGRRLSAGVYLVRLLAGDKACSARVTLLR